MKKLTNLKIQNIVIFGGLSNGKFNSKVEPLIDLLNVKRIYLFRFKGNPLNVKFERKINYYENFLFSKYFYYIYTFIIVFFLSIRNKITTLISFYFLPFGLLVSIVGVVTKKPYIIILPGSDLKWIIKNKSFLFFLNKSKGIGVRGSNSKMKLENMGVSKDKIFVLHNAFNLPNFNYVEEKKWDIIFVGYFRKDKRLNIAVEVIHKLSLEIPSISAVFVGYGEDFDNIKSLIQKKQLEENILLMGHQEDISEYLKKSKIFLLTSKSEGLPMVLVESMCFGLPVVTSNINDISNIVKNNENGYLIQSLETNDYFNSLLKILNNQDLYNRLSMNARLSMERFYNEESSFESVQDTWSKILNKDYKYKV